MHQGANQQELCHQTAQSQISQMIVTLESFHLTARELLIHCGFYWHIRDQFVSSDFWNGIHTCSKISEESVGIDEGSLSCLELRTWWEWCWISFEFLFLAVVWWCYFIVLLGNCQGKTVFCMFVKLASSDLVIDLEPSYLYIWNMLVTCCVLFWSDFSTPPHQSCFTCRI